MARREILPELLREIRDLAAGWGKIVARRAFGDAGPGLDTDFDVMEQLARAAAAGPCPRANRSAIVLPVGGPFSPQRPLLRLDNHAYSPAAWRLLAQAAGRLGSFADAAFALALAGLAISPQHVRTLALEVGDDLTRQRDAKATRGRRRLPVRVAQTPTRVAVEVDGGRLRTRAADAGPGVHA